MKIIGLTGQSGAGKSTVAKMISEHGYTVINADEVYHQLLKPNSELCLKLAEKFGEQILKNGEVDRKTLSKIVFSDNKKLQDLNRITHKYIIDQTLRIISELDAKGEVAVFYDAPQLFEAGFDKNCDNIIAVLADEEIREKRIIERDGIKSEDVKMRFNSQKSVDFFTENCDILVYNNGGTDALEKSVEDAMLCMGLKWEKQ